MGNRAEAEKREIDASVDLDEAPKSETVRHRSVFDGSRLFQDSASDVRWFFSDAPGILGLKASNWDGRSGSVDKEDTRVAEAAHRYETIAEVLEAIGHRRTLVLQRFYQEWSKATVPWRGLEAFGSMAGLAVLTTVAKRAYKDDHTGLVDHNEFLAWIRALSTRTMAGAKIAKDDAELKSKILSECDGMLRRASVAYETNKANQKKTRGIQAKARNRMIEDEARDRRENPGAWRERDAVDAE